MNNFEDINQTNFAFEEPIFSDTNVELPVEEKLVEPVDPKNTKKKKIIIGVTVFFVFLLILIVMVKLKKKPKIETAPEEPAKVMKDLSPLEERIENVRLELDAADPANQDLTFPPVNMKLRLDEKKR